MKIGGLFLQSKVARRIFALFILTALIPVAFLSLFSYFQVTRLLTEQTHRELAVFSSSYGRTAYDRLLLADRTLGNVVSELDRGLSSASMAQLSKPVLQSLVQVSLTGKRKVILGDDFESGKLGTSDLEHLRRGESLLLNATAAANGARRGARSVVIARLIDATNPAKGWIAAEIAPAFLWGVPDELPYMTHICVLNQNSKPLYCSNPATQHVMEKAAASAATQRARGPLTLHADDETHLAAVREVFVAAKFGKHYWMVIASRPESVALAPVSVFSVIFWGSLILSALLVMLLSVSQIRRTLIPLESLMAATRRVAKRDFSTPVDVKRGDEFGELAGTFNYMTTRLDRQFNVLSALSRIDRSILSDLDVARVINEVLVQLPQVVKSNFTAIFVLKHDSDRNGELYVASGTAGAQKDTQIAISNDIRKFLLMNPDGRWGDPNTAAMIYREFGMSAQDARKLFVQPVMWKDRLCGAMVLGWQDEASLAEEDLAYVRDFADRVGVVLYSSEREAQLYHQARYDQLTELPNRFLLVERLTQEIARAQRENRQLMLLFVALDRFKRVNDTIGYAGGDTLIWEAGMRLRKHIGEGDTLARFGGHEFVILLSGNPGEKQADVVAKHVISALAQPFLIKQVESFITASVGIALYPDAGKVAADLLRNADTACARASGQETFVFFNERMNKQALQRAELERDLRRAIEQRQFMLYYQPKTELQTGRIIGAEALIRWQHPQRGIVNPVSFITLAEETGLIVEMGRFALAEGCRQFGEWRERGIHLGQIAINVSSRQFQSGDVLDDVRRNLLEHKLQPGELELEVTESLMVDSFDEVTRVLKAFRDHGASVALDDFGTGYSSMSYLEILPFDTLKIDMSFIRRIKGNGEGGAIAMAIIAMAHSLQKKLVAEGVETQAQVDFLKRHGCHIAQGFFFGRPLPAVAFEAFLRERKQLQ